MKPQTILVAFLLACCSVSAFAQQGPGRGPITTPRDPELEKQSYHNLDVARYYFYKRKPDKGDKDGWTRLNKAVLDRLNEILDTNPAFAKVDEVYFLMGEVYQRDNQPDKAVENWRKVAEDFPDSQFRADAKKRLEAAAQQDAQKKSEKKG